jgi:hypothetical protein
MNKGVAGPTDVPHRALAPRQCLARHSGYNFLVFDKKTCDQTEVVMS